MVINELVSFEKDQFEHEYADSNWFKGKQTKYIEAMEQARARSKLGATSDDSYRRCYTGFVAYVVMSCFVASPNEDPKGTL